MPGRKTTLLMGVAGLGLVVAAAVVVLDSPAPRTATPAAASDDDRLAELVARTPYGDVDARPLPVADDPAGTLAFLTGDGGPGLQLVPRSEPLWRDGRGACEQVASSLSEVGTPEELLAMSAGTPDAVARELLVGLHSQVADVLSACGDDAAFDAALPDFAWQWAVTDRRLRELGVPR